MTAATTTAPSGEHITADERHRLVDLDTNNGRRRYLCEHLGIDQRQARVMLAQYATERRIGNDTARSDHDFIAWLMRQAPEGYGFRRPVRKHDWRVAS